MNPDQTQRSHFTWAALVVFDIIEATYDPPEELEYLERLNSNIFTQREDGKLSGVHSAARTACSELTLLGGPLSEAFILHYYRVHKYLARVAVVPFPSERLAEAQTLLHSQVSATETLTIRDRLLPRSTPRPSSVLASTVRGTETEGTALLLRAEGSPSAQAELLKAALGVLNFSTIPAVFEGLLVLPGSIRFPRGPCFTFVAPTLHPSSPSTSSGVTVPAALISLLKQFAREQILNKYAVRICRLPFARHSPSEYLQQFSHRDVGLLSSYLNKHLREREQAVDEVQEAETVLENLVVEDTRVADVEHWHHVYPPLLHPYANHISSSFTLSFTEAVKRLRTSTALVTRHILIATDHLRDLLAARVADSNLRLQQTLFWIAVFALLVSVAALLVGVLTDDAKKTLLEYLVTFRLRSTS